MEIGIQFVDKEQLPELGELVSFIWQANINLSKAGDALKFKDCTTLALSWDKWLDDKRWNSHPKSKEYIYFSFKLKENNECFNQITIEIDEDAIFVDKCAFYKAIEYITDKTNGKVIVNGTNSITLKEFIEIYQKYLKCSFEEAIEVSLNSRGVG